MRLAKYLAQAGVASRRAAEEIVRSGRVQVGAETVRDPARAVADGDLVTVDRTPVTLPAADRVVYAVNKPKGVVSTASDTHGRPTVVSLVPSASRLFPVGRLDIDTTGLILLTDDGELAHRLTHPRFEVEKTYRATVAHPPVREAALRRLRQGVELEDGISAPARARRLRPNMIELTLREGRKRQVRRMCEQVGHRVIGLERVAFGPLALGDLPPGAHRVLTAAELSALRAAGYC
ncbi:MAG TPA: pseudouridine synthase [Solirubrobacteraceae bacterium]